MQMCLIELLETKVGETSQPNTSTVLSCLHVFPFSHENVLYFSPMRQPKILFYEKNR